MKPRFLSLRSCALGALTLATTLATPLHAQEAAPEETDLKSRIWGYTSPAGTYEVRVDHISSISKTEYLIEGNIMVYEVTIDTIGQTTARFYYGEPWTPKTSVGAVENATNRARDIGNTLNQRAGQVSGQVDRLVIKNYGPPNTTHAKTIEFKVANRSELNQVYQAARNSWIKGRGRNMRVKDE
ncbi:hypothetical protein [Sulfuriroseicoccus oceanibius]|uniref:Uncharacterized protein n=1 Tax=Sulfuriroseicoccus oceanibius TaxID=2707525 RepID=A0A6B3LEC1_9BACT|nr:hypothetical protein [Sulfuriroseicoccus oceanibius]QQL44441.1 hypothetical protein G3M56_011170 [Sulfuriroseicoccus oceanibius]